MASSILRVRRTSESESMMTVRFCFISSITVSRMLLVFVKVLNFQFPVASSGVTSQL